MSHPAPGMIDAVFDVSGGTLPPDYPFALWDALLAHVPALAEDALVGVLPLKTAESEAGRLLPKRAKLVLRLPARFAGHCDTLSGRQLDIGVTTLRLGSGKLRDIQPYSTLHAHLVTGAEDEVEFLQEMTARLAELGIAGKLICGMRNRMTAPDRMIHGYSLVVHDLKPDASLQLQYTGLGAERRFGCGIFIPYKAITDLD
ncbi:MAG TPA: type I-MYXAN CRISPR-associated protein Cas6/Cmx6 [Sideroxyarcus sp.]|nr:type I-MYXAN CRISPR-associated protein Cas6/Cmx6 [Sideroxyarcus sp.]